MKLILLIAESLLLLAGLLTGHIWAAVGIGAGFVYLLIALQKPELAWALVWLAFPFSIESLFPGGIALNVPTEPMILIALVAWGALALAGRPVIRLPSSDLNLPLAALGAAALLSALLGSEPLVGIKAWLAIAIYVVFGYAFRLSAWNGPSRIDRFVPWIVGSAALWGLYGAVHVATGGVSLRVAYGLARPFFTEHGAYAAYLAMILPMSVVYAMERRGHAGVLYGAASVAIALGIVFSLTRAAWVSIAIVLPPTLFLWGGWRRSLAPLVPAAVLALALALVLPATQSEQSLGRHVESIGKANDPSNLERINRWVAAVAMAKDHPLLGVGVGAYPDAYHLYRRKIFFTELVYQRMGAHSEPFRLLAEMGLIGLLAALWLLLATFRTGVRAFLASRDPATRAVTLSVLAGLATFCLHGFFRTYFDLEKVAVPFWAGLGVIAAAGSVHRGGSPPGLPSTVGVIAERTA
ncbi:MAG TPA: O-antigen ligase family protein [Candidatus Eisenbacteria bacterium]|nr:O-antigen ligase family protein [Candidatus Eisenbacteria bacterium]